MSPPPIDPLEPNDDLDQIKAHGLFPVAKPLVKGALKARADVTDDPEDVYRVKVPAHAPLTVTMKPDANVNLELWGPLTATVAETGTARRRDLLGLSARPSAQAETSPLDEQRARRRSSSTPTSSFRPAARALDADYTITIRTARARP